MQQRDETELDEETKMDGNYVNGRVRPKNKKEDRVDRRLAENQKPGKSRVIVMRSRDAQGEGGAVRRPRARRPIPDAAPRRTQMTGSLPYLLGLDAAQVKVGLE